MTGLVFMAAAWAGIAVEGPPVVGQETVVAVVDSRGEPRVGETVRVFHRPGLAGEKELAVGITDGRGRVRWTPAMGGLARLRAGSEPFDVRVAWDATPRHVPVLLALVALGGLIALGYGLGVGVRRR